MVIEIEKLCAAGYTQSYKAKDPLTGQAVGHPDSQDFETKTRSSRLAAK